MSFAFLAGQELLVAERDLSTGTVTIFFGRSAKYSRTMPFSSSSAYHQRPLPPPNHPCKALCRKTSSFTRFTEEPCSLLYLDDCCAVLVIFPPSPKRVKGKGVAANHVVKTACPFRLVALLALFFRGRLLNLESCVLQDQQGLAISILQRQPVPSICLKSLFPSPLPPPLPFPLARVLLQVLPIKKEKKKDAALH